MILCLTFTIFLFTSDGHRYTIDEFHGQEMAFRMTTLQPDPNYVAGESKFFFNAPIFNPYELGPICSNGITCYPISIFYSITQVPFIAINHYFSIIDDDTVVFSLDNFVDPHYLFGEILKIQILFLWNYFTAHFSLHSSLEFFS